MKNPHSPFSHYRLVSSLEIIHIGNTGNQNHPDLEVRVVLVTCFSNIDFFPILNSNNGEYILGEQSMLQYFKQPMPTTLNHLPANHQATNTGIQ